MKVYHFFGSIFFLALLISCTTEQDIRQQNLQILIDSEKTFARTSAEIGMRTAFTRWLDDSAIVFRPRPEKGKELYRNSPDVPGMLLWQPEFADLSAAGDLGYNSGPYEYRREGTGTTADGYGHFVSVWKMQPDGSWRVLIDLGISHAAPDFQLRDTTLVVHSPDRVRREFSIPDISRVRQLDAVFSDSAAVLGYHRALQTFATAEVRVYRENYFPFLGFAAVPPELDHPVSWTSLSAGVATSGDLGYTYGIAQSTTQPDGKTTESSYLRIWRRTDSEHWKLVLEITNPIL